MKKILYFVVFTFLCFVGLNDVEGYNGGCNYKTKTSDGIYDITVTFQNNSSPSVMINDKSLPVNNFIYNYNEYAPSKFNNCPSYMYRIRKQGESVNEMILFTNEAITGKTKDLPMGKVTYTFDVLLEIPLSSKADSLVGKGDTFECTLVNIVNKKKITYVYEINTKEEYFKINGQKKSIKKSEYNPYSNGKKCPILVKYDGGTPKFYYNTDTVIALKEPEKLYVSENTPMAYCEYSTNYGTYSMGYIGRNLHKNMISTKDTTSGATLGSIAVSNFIKDNNPYCHASLPIVKKGSNIEMNFDENGKNELAKLTKGYVYPKTTTEESKIAEDYKMVYSCKYEQNWTLVKYANGEYILNQPNGTKGELTPNSDSYNEVYSNSTSCPSKIHTNKQTYSLEGKTDTANDILTKAGVLSGERYKQLLWFLYPYLFEKGVSDGKGVSIDGNANVVLSKWPNFVKPSDEDEKTSISSGDNLDYELETKIQDVARYCNDFYGNYYNVIKKKGNTELIEKRMEECISFDEYYTWLVQQGYVRNLQGECGIISQDMIGIINWVLNIIKIAGPILAIVLGMLDFAKVMVAEDADKTYKEAWKKFIRRIIAAVLLLLTPMLLSFILNFALGGQDGYDTENPFCNMADWSEVSE